MSFTIPKLVIPDYNLYPVYIDIDKNDNRDMEIYV